MQRSSIDHRCATSAFTLIEVLVVIAIMAVFGLVSVAGLYKVRSSKSLPNAANQIEAILRQAQVQAVNGYQATAWGVHFANGLGSGSSSFYALFRGGTYSAAAVVGYYPLPTDVGYVTSTLAQNASSDVVFALLSGAASASTSIGLYSKTISLQSSTLRISSSGQVSY